MRLPASSPFNMPLRALVFGSSPLNLPCHTPLGDVLQLMLTRQTNHVALSDPQGRYLGMISARALLTRVLPVSARVEQGLADLGFAGDALPMLVEHLREISALPAQTLLDPHEIVLHTDTALTEAALLLSRSLSPLPVLDAENRLVGMLSPRALLAFIAAQAAEH